MKKFLVGLLTVALAASMLVGCAKKEEKKKADNSLKDVQSKKELILGLDASFPPMGFTDKKQNIVGFDIDLAKEVTKRMGIKLKLQPINCNIAFCHNTDFFLLNFKEFHLVQEVCKGIS